MSKPSKFDRVADIIRRVAGHAAEMHNLSTEVVLERLSPIDIFVFGRSGIGKSQLIQAITNVKMDSSPQLDHVTQKLTALIHQIGPLTFRFWDTKGIDSWEDVNAVGNLFKEMVEQKINPIFVIYCAASGGRVNSDIVTWSSEQFGAQMEGGHSIMEAIFQQTPSQVGRFRFEYEKKPEQDSGTDKTARGLLIGVNSCVFTNLMGTMAPFNIHELMDFLASNLNDEEFTKFVALTMNNRNFWDRVHDRVRSRLMKIKHTVLKWDILPSYLVGWFSSRS